MFVGIGGGAVVVVVLGVCVTSGSTGAHMGDSSHL